MNFHEDGIDAACNAGPSKVFDVLRLSTRCFPKSARKLKRVRYIEHDRYTERTHDRKRPEINDEIVIPETCTALSEKNLLTARRLHQVKFNLGLFFPRGRALR